MTVIKQVEKDTLINIFYLINIVIFSIYLLLYLNDTYHLINNIYAADRPAQGYGYRVEGPTLLIFILFPFLYIINNRKIDRRYLLVFIIGFISLFLNASFLSIILFFSIYFIGYIKFTVINIIRLVTATLLVITVFYVLVIPVLHPSFVKKLGYISHPWEYPTIKTRINDLNYMLDQTTNNWGEILIGSGVGVKSTVYRENKTDTSLSAYLTFLEIDNGYYYIYHRAGLIGLFLLISANLYLILSSKNVKIKLMYSIFFFVFLAVSNHFFTDAISALFVAALVYKND